MMWFRHWLALELVSAWVSVLALETVWALASMLGLVWALVMGLGLGLEWEQVLVWELRKVAARGRRSIRAGGCCLR